MKKFLRSMILPLAIIPLACGEDQPQYIQAFSYDVADNVVKLEAEFNSDITLNTDLTLPILEYGQVSFEANDDQYGFRIKTALNMDALIDPEILSLSRTRNLPNNQSMSSWVQTDVGRLRIRGNDDIAASVYFGLEPQQFYLGVALELNFIDEQFPAGLVLSQRVRDAEGRMLAVVSLFGPEVVDGEMKSPGGLFIISNVSELINYQASGARGAMVSSSLMPEEKTTSNREDYESPASWIELWDLYHDAGRDAGYVNTP